MRFLGFAGLLLLGCGQGFEAGANAPDGGGFVGGGGATTIATTGGREGIAAMGSGGSGGVITPDVVAPTRDIGLAGTGGQWDGGADAGSGGTATGDGGTIGTGGGAATGGATVEAGPSAEAGPACQTQAEACGAQQCGEVTEPCGTVFQCGTCAGSERCNAGTCETLPECSCSAQKASCGRLWACPIVVMCGKNSGACDTGSVCVTDASGRTACIASASGICDTTVKPNPNELCGGYCESLADPGCHTPYLYCGTMVSAVTGKACPQCSTTLERWNCGP